MSMEKRIFFTIFIALTFSGVIVICTLGRSIHYHRVQAKIAAAASQVEDPLYTVIDYRGEIGVFRRGRLDPYMVLETDMRLLSEYDREELEKGIYFYSDDELRRYIEDVLS